MFNGLKLFKKQFLIFNLLCFYISFIDVGLITMLSAYLPPSLGQDPDNKLQWDQAVGVDASVVNYTILMSITYFMVSILTYSLLQRGGWSDKWSRVFSCRKHLHPTVTIQEPKFQSLFGWFKNVMKTPDYDYMMSSGLDSLMTTKMHVCLFKICFFCALYGVFVLIPINFSQVSQCVSE